MAALVAAAAAFLPSCASQPLRVPRTTLPSSFEAKFAAGVDVQQLDHWWTLFADSQLNALVDEALVSAPDARRALAVLAESRAERAKTLTAFDPQGAVTASITRQRSSAAAIDAGITPTIAGSSTSSDSGFTPSWEIDLFGRRAANARTANADFAAARFDYEGSRQSLAANVAANLFEARGLATQIVEARETSRIARDLAGVGAKRVAVGIGSRADAASLVADAAAADANVLSLESQLAISKRSLLVLTGRGEMPLEALVIEPRLQPPPPLPVMTPGDLLVRRPDVRAAEARVQSAAGKLRLDQLALFPTLNLLPGATATRVESPFDYSSQIWSLGLGLTLPVLDRPRLLAEIRAENARGEQAVIAYETAVQQAYGEAESRLTALAADQAQLARLKEAEDESRMAFEAQRLGFRAGIVDLTTLLTAERTWRANLSALSTLQAGTLRAAVDTFKAFGGGWTPPERVAVASTDLRP
jgi:NodT family efflux transporter outer membrane factor (OMF) lipoprotein